jgi:hypothetical protein
MGILNKRVMGAKECTEGLALELEIHRAISRRLRTSFLCTHQVD